ncbi:MAG: OFA family MFS transporter [Ilumatobacter sp.]|uniref:L-lactate MFS transporter n=1 Tax=Ilumatobacter sp. TaxID=1967498 RepID=UPI0026132D22|nr:OFA family MFS transporter [Ilumatobacter sp.]MDJ0767500.1 OFA family MFS transporter [Ilumatobacter sp.]
MLSPDRSIPASQPLRRWPVVVGAVLIQLCLGAIYAWSVFTPDLKDSGWSNVETQFVFSTGLASFAIVMVLAGRNLEKLGPRKLAVAGGLTLGVGYAIASIGGGDSFWPVLLGIGLVGGSGIGLGYVVPIAVGMRWFPDHKGAITGLAVAGFGFGALGWIKIAGSWGGLIDEIGLGSTFFAYGVAFATIVLLGSFAMTMPPEGWLPPGFTPPVAAGEGSEDFTPREMLRMPQFHLMSLTFAMSAGAGLMAIGLMKLYPPEVLTDNGLSESEADAIAGTAMAVFFSLANGAGRVLWGVLSDKLGRKRSVVTMAATQGAFLILFIPMASNEWTLYLAATLIGFNFGGNFALFPALTADEFGNSAVGKNYPWVFLSYGAGGIVFPILGGWLGDTGNFPLAFTICGVGCVVGAIATAMVFPPNHDEATEPLSVHGFLHHAHLFDHAKSA